MMKPKHITIIMDGNGRWANKQGFERLVGHNAGTESVRSCCEYCVEHGVEYLSLFAFSEENWNRPADEISGLMKLMVKAILDERPTFMKNNIRFMVKGDRSKLPEGLLSEIDAVSAETEKHSGLTIVIFLSYSGKWDILQATQRYAQAYSESVLAGGQPLSIDAHSYEKYLDTYGIPDPDLMIRTSGEQRISNFLLWQLAYTELYFTDVLWPDFRRNHLEEAINSFTGRERRFGKTGEQIKGEV